jgi:hypothetical protein
MRRLPHADESLPSCVSCLRLRAFQTAFGIRLTAMLSKAAPS